MKPLFCIQEEVIEWEIKCKTPEILLFEPKENQFLVNINKNYNVRKTCSIEECFLSLQLNHFDIIILCCEKNSSKHVELCKNIRQEFKNHFIPVIILLCEKSNIISKIRDCLNFRK